MQGDLNNAGELRIVQGDLKRTQEELDKTRQDLKAALEGSRR